MTDGSAVHLPTVASLGASLARAGGVAPGQAQMGGSLAKRQQLRTFLRRVLEDVMSGH